MKVLKFHLLNKLAKIPEYAHDNDAGFDIFSSEDCVIKKGKFYGVPTGISSEIPNGYFVSIRDKSGLAINSGIHVMGGVIDAGYRGEWKVILINFGNKDFEIKSGNKIAQGVFIKLEKTKIKEVRLLKKSERGKKGFGSTGK